MKIVNVTTSGDNVKAGGKGRSFASDTITICKRGLKNGKLQVGFRVGADLMRKYRWLIGDKVLVKLVRVQIESGDNEDAPVTCGGDVVPPGTYLAVLFERTADSKAGRMLSGVYKADRGKMATSIVRVPEPEFVVALNKLFAREYIEWEAVSDGKTTLGVLLSDEGRKV